MNDEPRGPDGVPEVSPSPPPKRKITAAGRLVALVTTDSVLDLARLARSLAVPERHLLECRDGLRRLEPEVQMLLAAYVMEGAPQHAAVARRLHAQAQSEYRVRERSIDSHETYDRPPFR